MNCCGNSCSGAGYNTCIQTYANNNAAGMPNFAFILVLFILLVICGTAYIF